MISVIIPVYNTESYLKRCVNSIINQTYKDLQIILVNDGSTDNSITIMQKFKKMDSRILVIDKPHKGVSAARNAGIEAATGDYISFIDSDDWLENDAYQVLLDILQKKDADAVYFGWNEEFSDGTSTGKRHKGNEKKVIDGDEIIKWFLNNEIPLRVTCALMRNTLLENVVFEVGRELGEDMLFCFLTLAKANRIVYVDIPLYHRFHRIGSLANQLQFKRSYFGTATCTDVMIEYIQQNRPQFLQEAYIFSFNFYMFVLNHISYYRCEKEFLDIYDAIRKRLQELWKLIDSPIRKLPVRLSGAYIVFNVNKVLYHYCMVVYYHYIKKELGGKRQQ